ncbi:hypothetical protein [Actinomadura sp. 9N407]|uniref:hypothetical protein n=1 Tax=Actinomadura sp. 9N407 TaxID=3375154 RepID=UPI00379992CF
MGVYISEVTFQDWSGPLLKLGSALDLALAERNLPLFMPEPRAPDRVFEEKLIPSMEGFADLFGPAQEESLDWDMVIPIDFAGSIVLPVPSSHSGITTIRSAHRLLEATRSLADRIGLPAEVPIEPTNLALTSWSLHAERPDGPAGLGRDRLDAVFYIAVFLRAAERSIQHDCAIQVT